MDLAKRVHDLELELATVKFQLVERDFEVHVRRLWWFDAQRTNLFDLRKGLRQKVLAHNPPASEDGSGAAKKKSSWLKR